jgi:SnoaL-like domain
MRPFEHARVHCNQHEKHTSKSKRRPLTFGNNDCHATKSYKHAKTSERRCNDRTCGFQQLGHRCFARRAIRSSAAITHVPVSQGRTRCPPAVCTRRHRPKVSLRLASDIMQAFVFGYHSLSTSLRDVIRRNQCPCGQRARSLTLSRIVKYPTRFSAQANRETPTAGVDGPWPTDGRGPADTPEKESNDSPSTPEQEVIDALIYFYEAIQAADLAVMENIWLPGSDAISVAHPFHGLAVGRDEVFSTWRTMFALGKVVDVDVEIVRVEVSPNMAWCVAIQHLTTSRANETIGGRRIATNIFQMWKGQWKMVYHGAAPVFLEDMSGMQDAQDSPQGDSGGRVNV